MLLTKIIALTGTALAVTACGSRHGGQTSSSSPVDPQCAAAAAKFGPDVIATRSFTTTGRAYDDWRTTRTGARQDPASKLPAQYSPMNTLIVCDLQGDFGPVRNPPPLSGAPPSTDHYRTAEYVVLPDGTLMPDWLDVDPSLPAGEPGPSPS
jgi:hypothetical protein